MTRVKITLKDGYRCAPEGHTTITIPFGTIVTGQVAAWALADHAGSAMFNPVAETKVTPPLEKKKRGRPRKVRE